MTAATPQGESLHDVFVRDARRGRTARQREGAAFMAGSRAAADAVDHNPFGEAEPKLRSAWARGRRQVAEAVPNVGTYASRSHDASGGGL